MSTRHGSENCIATGSNSAGLVGGVFTVDLMLINALHGLVKHEVLGTVAERWHFTLAAVAAVAAWVLSTRDCIQKCGNSTPLHQSTACDTFYESLSITLSAISFLPLIMISALVWFGQVIKTSRNDHRNDHKGYGTLNNCDDLSKNTTRAVSPMP